MYIYIHTYIYAGAQEELIGRTNNGDPAGAKLTWANFHALDVPEEEKRVILARCSNSVASPHTTTAEFHVTKHLHARVHACVYRYACVCERAFALCARGMARSLRHRHVLTNDCRERVAAGERVAVSRDASTQ